jgi:hypothetical protein
VAVALYVLDRWELGRRWDGSGNPELDGYFELLAAEVLAQPGGSQFIFSSDQLRNDLSGLASESEIDQWLDSWLPADRFRLCRASWTNPTGWQPEPVEQPVVRPPRRRRCSECGALHAGECPEQIAA